MPECTSAQLLCNTRAPRFTQRRASCGLLIATMPTQASVCTAQRAACTNVLSMRRAGAVWYRVCCMRVTGRAVFQVDSHQKNELLRNSHTTIGFGVGTRALTGLTDVFAVPFDPAHGARVPHVLQGRDVKARTPQFGASGRHQRRTSSGLPTKRVRCGDVLVMQLADGASTEVSFSGNPLCAQRAQSGRAAWRAPGCATGSGWSQREQAHQHSSGSIQSWRSRGGAALATRRVCGASAAGAANALQTRCSAASRHVRHERRHLLHLRR